MTKLKNTSETEDDNDFEGKSDQSGKLNILIFVLALFIVVLEVVLSLFGIAFETKLAVEGASSLLAILVSIGLVGSKKKGTYEELKTEIKDQILKNKAEISKTTEQISKKTTKNQK